MEIRDRLKAARAALGLTQAEAASKFALPIGSLRKYESGPSEPGSSALAGIVRAGINANWLLTGEGPMLLADLNRPAEAPAPAKVNIPALTAILRGLIQAGTPPDRAVSAAMEFYQISIERGLITPEGIGSGGKAAA